MTDLSFPDGTEAGYEDVAFPDGDPDDDTLKLFAESSDPANPGFYAEIGFALAAAIASPASLAPTQGGLAAFQIYSEMYAYAQWAPGDITISGVLWLTALHPDTIDRTSGTGDLDDHNIIKQDLLPARDYERFGGGAPPALGFFGTAPGFTRTNDTTATLRTNTAPATGTILIPFVGATTGNTVIRFTSPTGTVMGATNYTVSAAGITFTAARSDTIRTLAADTPYYISINVDGTHIHHRLNIVVTP
jgi:hypothetical protein